jgi:predicted nucleotidyltransferase
MGGVLMTATMGQVGDLFSKMRAPAAGISMRYNSGMDSIRLKIPRAEIARFCKRWNVSEFAIFGSALRSDFRPDSDVDALVSFSPQAHVTLFDMARMQEELKTIFGHNRVDSQLIVFVVSFLQVC